jgi:hypothetical protein
MSDGLTEFLRQNRSESTFGAALGLFDPIGLSLTLNWSDHPEASYESRLMAMAALLHERTHWLQFIGTAAGQFLAWVGTLQATLLTDPSWLQEPLDVTDLPLLDSDRVNSNQKHLWLACERLFVSTFSAPRPYVDRIFKEGGFQRDAISRYLRALGSTVLDKDSAYEEAQNRMEKAVSGEGDEIPMIDDAGVVFGALHCMEGAARANELFKLADGFSPTDQEMSLDGEAYLFPPYSNARDFYFKITERWPGKVEDEVAICVLADWALNCLLPPLAPLTAALETPPVFPGTMFAFLAQNVEVDALPPQDEATRITWAEGFVHAIYEQIEERTEGKLPSPLHVAEFQIFQMKGLLDMEIPQSIYSPATEERNTQPAIEAARLRYLGILSVRAAQTRLEHPAFFPLPHVYYSIDRKFFHQLWDPIQPPLLSFGTNRHIPTEYDPDWFKFFYVSAIQHQLAVDAAYNNCKALGARLFTFRGAPLSPESEEFLLRSAVFSLFGDGGAGRAILDASYCPPA